MNTFEQRIEELHQRALTAPIVEAAACCEEIRCLTEGDAPAPQIGAVTPDPPVSVHVDPPTPAQLAKIRQFKYAGPVRSKQHASQILDKLFGKRKGGTR